LLAPHRSYLPILYSLLPNIKALAHLTGGGFIENIPRILPEDLDAIIHLDSWPVPPLWKLIQQKGNIATDEMCHIFNLGIGMVAILDRDAASTFQSALSEPTFVIGELVKGRRKVILQ
jgi:phosphoribosylformylglycinamidine cyclo-ligase